MLYYIIHPAICKILPNISWNRHVSQSNSYDIHTVHTVTSINFLLKFSYGKCVQHIHLMFQWDIAIQTEMPLFDSFYHKQNCVTVLVQENKVVASFPITYRISINFERKRSQCLHISPVCTIEFSQMFFVVYVNFFLLIFFCQCVVY